MSRKSLLLVILFSLLSLSANSAGLGTGIKASAHVAEALAKEITDFLISKGFKGSSKEVAENLVHMIKIAGKELSADDIFMNKNVGDMGIEEFKELRKAIISKYQTKQFDLLNKNATKSLDDMMVCTSGCTTQAMKDFGFEEVLVPAGKGLWDSLTTVTDKTPAGVTKAARQLAFSKPRGMKKSVISPSDWDSLTKKISNPVALYNTVKNLVKPASKMRKLRDIFILFSTYKGETFLSANELASMFSRTNMSDSLIDKWTKTLAMLAKDPPLDADGNVIPGGRTKALLTYLKKRADEVGDSTLYDDLIANGCIIR